MKKKLKFGGFTATEGLTSGAQAGSGIGNALVDMFAKPNQYGRQSGLATGIKQGANLAMLGAQVGGPIGAAAGGALGLGAGLIGSIGAKKKEEELARRANLEELHVSEMQGLQSLMADPESIDGSKQSQFFKFGGQMSPIGAGRAEVQGPSHAEGGVDLPNGAEVEGGETIAKNYVFSKELGFAQQHKPIAKAIGKISEKRETQVRKNTLHALQQREQDLALQQETVKHLLGI